MGQISVANLKIDSVLTELVDLTITESIIRDQIGYQFNSGSLKNEADEVFVQEAAIGAGITHGFNLLVAGNPFRVDINLSKVKLIWFKNTSPNSVVGAIDIFGSISNGFRSPWTATVVKNRLQSGGELLLIAPDINGFNVVNPTESQIEIKNNSATETLNYELLIVGVRA